MLRLGASAPPLPRASIIPPIIQGSDTTVEEVFQHKGFAEAVRTGAAAVVEFLLDPDHLTKILKYALSFDLASDCASPPDFRRLHRDSLKLLIDSVTTFRFKLAQSKTLWEYLATFRSSQDTFPIILRANYCRIIWALADASLGACLGNYLPDLADFLIPNLTILCFSELFSKLACRFRTGFGFDTDLMLAVLNNQPDHRASFLTLREVFKSPDCRAEIVDPFLIRICEISISDIDDHPLVSLEGFSLLSLLIKKSPDARTVIREQLSSLQLGGKSQIIVPSVLAIVPKLVEQVLGAFLSEDNTTFFNEAVAHALGQLPVAVLQELSARFCVVEKLVERWPAYVSRKVDGHLLRVVELLNSQHICCPPAVRAEWEGLLQGEVAARSALVNRPLPYIHVEVAEPVPIRRESNPRPRPMLNLLNS
jgi:hypothetical protein